MLKVFLENVIRDSVTYRRSTPAERRSPPWTSSTRSSARAARSTASAGKILPPSPGRRAAADQDQRWLPTAHLIHTRFLLKPPFSTATAARFSPRARSFPSSPFFFFFSHAARRTVARLSRTSTRRKLSHTTHPPRAHRPRVDRRAMSKDPLALLDHRQVARWWRPDAPPGPPEGPRPRPRARRPVPHPRRRRRIQETAAAAASAQPVEAARRPTPGAPTPRSTGAGRRAPSARATRLHCAGPASRAAGAHAPSVRERAAVVVVGLGLLDINLVLVLTRNAHASSSSSSADSNESRPRPNDVRNDAKAPPVDVRAAPRSSPPTLRRLSTRRTALLSSANSPA